MKIGELEEVVTDRLEVLDHGYVRLVDHMGSDLSIVRAARVSFDADWRVGENEGSDIKLIKYLWTHQHTTPFEAATLTFEVKAPIFVFRQWHRHRTQSYNEISARYTELPDEYYVPEPSVIGVQALKNKQSREGFDDEELIIRREQELDCYIKSCNNAFKCYKTLLDWGWPRELARGVLPVTTYSRMFTTANLLNWFKFLKLRLDKHAQFEIRQYADAILGITRKYFPICCETFMESL